MSAVLDITEAKGSLGTTRRYASTASSTASSGLEPGGSVRFAANERTYAMQHMAAELLPDQGVALCGRCCVSEADGVQLVRDTTGRAYARGLIRCKSVWACPVCAAKIAEQRRQELITVLSNWRADGGHVSMLTLTLPHHMGQSLEIVLQTLHRALKLFTSGRNSIKTVVNSGNKGYFGMIRALEVTHGLNGWHPHEHILILTDKPLDDDDKLRLQTRWAACLESAGFATPRPDVAAQLQDGSAAADYVSKTGWGMAEELSRAHMKKARGGRTPLQLLEAASLGDEWAASLFVEYAHVFKGRKQMFMSPAIKQYLAEVDKVVREDIEIIEEEQIEVAEVVGYVSSSVWALIYRYKMRAHLFNAIENDGADGLQSTLELLEVVHRDACRRRSRSVA